MFAYVKSGADGLDTVSRSSIEWTMTSEKPRRVYGYVRVSTDRQDLSLEVQAEKLKAMASIKGLPDLEIIVDEDESAKNLKRPGVQHLLAMVRAGEVSMIIIAKLDRLTRSVRDLAELVDLFNVHGVSLISVSETLDTSTAVGRMMLNVLATVAQWERETIGERTRDALRAKKARGERSGTVPWGKMVVEGKLVPCEWEEHVASEALRMRAEGCSLTGIAMTLNFRGYVTRKGTPWRFQYIAKMLKETA